MNPPRINNDDRGITVNKTGAVVALLGLLLSAGIAFNAASGQFARMQAGIDGLTQAAAQTVQDRREIDARLRALEVTREGTTEQIEALRRDLADIKEEQRATNAEIRELLATINRAIGDRTP